MLGLVVAVAIVGAQDVEQRTPGSRPPAALAASFDGLGAGFEGPQGVATLRNPSDNSLAVGRQHVVQIVNTRMAVFTKSGKPLYGPVPTNTVFRGFGGACEERNNGDAVARYDQLADRWLIVMPIFTRAATSRPDQPAAWTDDGRAHVSPPGRPNQPGAAAPLYQPPRIPDVPTERPGRAAADRQGDGTYSMCYAISATPDPLGAYYRYEFLRPLFPDYPRPAIWGDGYYVPTSTSDDPISDSITTQKHACVVDRAAMLRGAAAAEQCIVMNNVGFLNNADIDGRSLPPPGAPNVMMATSGTQLKKILEARTIDTWQFRVDWKNPANTQVAGPQPIEVSPYHYLCGGQLTNCVPQPGIAQRLDAQGDKIMARLAYRRLGDREMIVAAHSVDTAAGAGGVRWYEFRVDRARRITLAQQGTYAPDGRFRWLPSPAIDRRGNIGIGYSYGGSDTFAGQRFAARLDGDSPGQLTLAETILADGEAAQNAIRWEDYTQTAVDPSDDCTIWYVGDYLKNGSTTYSTKIGAFRLPGCR